MLNFLLLALLLAGCAMPGDAAPIVKIGLAAPFEGLGRPLGYEVLPAVKLAVAEANNRGELGRYRVALVALNDDDAAPAAAAQARALAQDPAVLGALGPFDSMPAAAAAAAFREAGLPALVAAPLDTSGAGIFSLCPAPAVLAAEAWERASASQGMVAGPANSLSRALPALRSGTPSPAGSGTTVFYTGDAAEAADQLLRWRAAGWQGTLAGGPDLARPWFLGRAGAAAEGTQALACAPPQEPPASFAEAYRTQTGAAPGPAAVLAYAGARQLLQAMAEDTRAHRQPTRQGTAAALAKLAGPMVSGQPAATWLRVVDGKWAAAQ